MRASERSRRRRLLLRKAFRGIAEHLFLWYDQPRVERALRDGRALDAQELTPRGRQSRGTTRAHKLLVYESAALWTRVTGVRASGIMEILGPELLVHVPVAFCERWAGGQSDGRLCQVSPWYFLTRLVPSSWSHRSSTRCRRVDTPRLHSPRGRCCYRPIFLYSLSFSSLVVSVPLLPQCRPSLRACLPLRHIWADYSWHGPPGRAAALG